MGCEDGFKKNDGNDNKTKSRIDYVTHGDYYIFSQIMGLNTILIL